MYVVINHNILDREAFWAAVKRTSEQSPPQGTEGTHFLVSADESKAVCIYRTDRSLSELSQMVDGALGDSAEQSYFIVNAEVSSGLAA